MTAQSHPDRKPSICFVALNAYNVLSGRKDVNHTGGAEVQQLEIASWLVRRGYPVSVVTLDHGQPDGIDIAGIRIFKAYAKGDGVRGLRFFHPRWSGLSAAMARANADLYYQRGADCETGQVGLWCRLRRRRFIFAAANDSDCDSSLYALTSRREKVLYRLGLRLADAVTAQTATQQALLRRNMGVEATVVRNCGSTAGGQAYSGPLSINPGGPLHVLWVGRISEQKRLEWLLDVAERRPEITFDVVGAPNEESSYSSSVIARAGGIRNIKMHGRVPHAKMAEYYQRCHVLCCTSAYEGFPNTFLEAWSLGIPVVSTFDPDGVIAANGLGWVAQDVERVVVCLRRIIQSPDVWTEASEAVRRYYLANHTPEVCLPAFERLLLRVAGCEINPA
jgi:glycosyltransferase involved in cell wall biosynthesis